VDAKALHAHAFRRILVIKLSAFGDVIHALPLLHRLRSRYPQAQIDWLVMAGNAEIIRSHPALDRVVVFDDTAWRRPRRLGPQALRDVVAFGRALRAARYDLVIDLQGQLRSAVCALLAGAPVRIGFERPHARAREAATGIPAARRRRAWTGAREGAWLAYTHTVPVESADLHAVDRYLRAGDLLGCAPAAADFAFPIAPEAAAGAAALLRRHGIEPGGEPPFVLLAPGTVWDTKQWTPDGFAAVARHVLKRGMPVVLVGAGRDRDACRAVAERAPGVIDLCGRTSQGELAAITRFAAAVVANDSGPMHLAVALGRPTVAIFGPTDPRWAGPYGQPEAVVAAGVACAPCYLRDLRRCPNGHACMRDLPPEAVIARLEAALGDAAALARPAAELAAQAAR
jgi:lipopolysaccharide heptosyltransferase I